jgi:ATP-binding cassette subfamily B multidrug efflux pump
MNKTLLKSVREYKKQSVLAPFFVILEVLMEVLIPMEMAKIIDVGIMQGNLSYIVRRGLILVIMAMLALYFGIIAGKMAATAGAGYAKNLRHDIFYKVQEFSFKNIDRFSTSGLVTRMTTDITNVQMAYMMSIRLLARAPIMIVLSWIMTLLINKKIALLFLIIIPLLGGTLIFIAKKAHPHFIKVFDEYDILNNSVQENVNASRVVKAFVREDHEIEKFHGISKYVYTLFTKAEKIVAWNSPVMQFTIYTAMLLMDRRKRNCIRCDGNRRNDQCDRVCVPDHDGSDDGYICICYDHDRRSVYRPYYGSSDGSSGDAGQKECGYRSGRRRDPV